MGTSRVRALVVAVCLCGVLSGCADESVEPAPQPPTSELKAQIDQKWDDFHSRYPDIARPAVEVKRVVDIVDADAVMLDCIGGAGFPNGEFTSGQESSLALAYYVCAAEFPVDPKYNRPFDDEQWNYVYDYYVDELVPCLEREGYEPPTGPSRQVYVDNEGQGKGWWFPYEGVDDANTSDGEWERINDVCPQYPLEVYDLK